MYCSLGDQNFVKSTYLKPKFQFYVRYGLFSRKKRSMSLKNDHKSNIWWFDVKLSTWESIIHLKSIPSLVVYTTRESILYLKSILSLVVYTTRESILYLPGCYIPPGKSIKIPSQKSTKGLYKNMVYLTSWYKNFQKIREIDVYR